LQTAAGVARLATKEVGHVLGTIAFDAVPGGDHPTLTMTPTVVETTVVGVRIPSTTLSPITIQIQSKA